MAKKKHKREETFADRAKKIMAKYKSRLGENLDKDDPLARRAMERELQELAAEQESVKQSMQEEEMSRQMAYGGSIDPVQPISFGTTKAPDFNLVGAVTGSTKANLPFNSSRYLNTMGTNIAAPAGIGYRTSFSDYNAANEIDMLASPATPASASGAPANTNAGTGSYNPDDANGMDWPSYVGPALQGAASIASLLFNKRPAAVNFNTPTLSSFKKTNLDPERNMLREKYANTVRSVNTSDQYATSAMGRMASSEFMKGLSEISQKERELNNPNSFNLDQDRLRLSAAEAEAKTGQVNTAMNQEWQKNTIDIIRRLGVQAAMFPENVAQYKQDAATTKALSQYEYKIDANGNQYRDYGSGLVITPDGDFSIDGGKSFTTKEEFDKAMKANKKITQAKLIAKPK